MSTTQCSTDAGPSKPPIAPAHMTDEETEKQIASILTTAGSTMSKIRRKADRWSEGTRNREYNLARAKDYETQAFAQFNYMASCIRDYWSSHDDIGTGEFIRDIGEAKDNLLIILRELVFEIGNTGQTKLASIKEVEEEGYGEDRSRLAREVGSLSIYEAGVKCDEGGNGLEIVMSAVEESTARLVDAICSLEGLSASGRTRKTLRERISLAGLGFRPSSRNGVPRGKAPAVENRSERKRDKFKRVLQRKLSFKGKGTPVSFSPAGLP
ncbi:hypothetical protein C7212DRAFT_362445 [Tuber magnatum]|uniref:Uncharacterized protein n=1 Tax=Tuber magnatum TaxID=42249 RepID=A0A317SWR2_9PEZI|nr:hypothetical protein C7212DRAFT_362445 [Tuber magnatum]